MEIVYQARHEIHIDDVEEPEDVSFQAYCNCGWDGEWQHSDSFPAGNWESDPSGAVDAALAAAQAQGAAHIAEVGRGPV